jgi:hypothetical protein
MKNPIPRSGMFATPVDEQDLFTRIEQLTSSERQIALMFSMFTMNLAYEMVEKELVKERELTIG